MPSQSERGRKRLNIVELVCSTGSCGFYWTTRATAPYLMGRPSSDFGGPYASRLEAASEALCAHPPGFVALEPIVIRRNDLDEPEGGWPIKSGTLRLTVSLSALELAGLEEQDSAQQGSRLVKDGEIEPQVSSTTAHLEVLSYDLVPGSTRLVEDEGRPVLELYVDARWRHPARENPTEFLRALRARVTIPRLDIKHRPARHAFMFRAIPNR